MLIIKNTSKFKTDYILAIKRGYDINLLDEIIIKIAKREPLLKKHNDHALKGRYKGFRECHILPDWLLVYLIDDKILTLTLARTGTHADLF
jgi:mRNA interferase YafQ